MSKEAMKQALEALKNNRRKHYGCEDSWYSCPKHEDGCYNEHAGSECTCGADEANAEIDAAIKVLQEAQQEPVAWKHSCNALLVNDLELWIDHCPHCGKPRATPPAQRIWVGLTDEELFGLTDEMYSFARHIEAKLKEKNT